VLGGRRNARAASLATLEPQIALAAEVNPELPAELEGVSRGEDYDTRRAVVVGQSFARRWEARAAIRLANGADPASAAVDGLEDEAWRLEMIAATEAAEAFDAQRQDELDAYSEQIAYQTETRREAAVVPFRWWNAVLDKRTCRTCSVAHGKIVLLGLDFPEGRPGGVHPNCRCVDDIVLLPAWYRRYDTALEAVA